MSQASLLIRGARWVDGHRDEPLDLLVTPEIVRPAGKQDAAEQEIDGRGLVAMPGLTLALIVLAFVFVGDALNDALNPRIRER